MNKEEMISVIYDILKHKLELPTILSFHNEARLNEDLYMDSVMILELILHIELDFGINIPDEMLVPKDFHTISTLVEFIQRQRNTALGGIE
ncbi:petrobactin biosynthesis protein AsbD [Litchfieldia salsa]|uniref:Acyl carrier protein n=1 Tax=Litchfieldia salsa TaxID=930152 RepID=A0A1H0S116_9BACI|nr:petrobactin biosynthesis protein AsbD [Litchfieldia salsa]SDP35403.1 acyl carrier protein [Litchfieldia salsa]